MEKKPLIYICGPISKGDYPTNIANAIDAAEFVWKAGGIPFIPHQDFLWNLKYPKKWEESLDYDKQVIMRCNALYRFNRLPSVGSDEEEKFVKENNIPFFDDKERLTWWIINYGKKNFEYSRFD